MTKSIQLWKMKLQCRQKMHLSFILCPTDLWMSRQRKFLEFYVLTTYCFFSYWSLNLEMIKNNFLFLNWKDLCSSTIIQWFPLREAELGLSHTFLIVSFNAFICQHIFSNHLLQIMRYKLQAPFVTEGSLYLGFFKIYYVHISFQVE